MVIVHKKGRLHRNVDALSRLETSPVQHLVQATTWGEEWSSSSEEDDEDLDFDDSFADMTEAERLQFLDKRDKFVNAEFARIAQLEDDSEGRGLPPVVVGRSFFARYSTDGTDTDKELDPWPPEAPEDYQSYGPEEQFGQGWSDDVWEGGPTLTQDEPASSTAVSSDADTNDPDLTQDLVNAETQTRVEQSGVTEQEVIREYLATLSNSIWMQYLRYQQKNSHHFRLQVPLTKWSVAAY